MEFPPEGIIMNKKLLYCSFESPLGDMIAGATGTGVCFLEWHDRGGVPRILERVRRRYGRDLEEGSNAHLVKLRDELSRYFAGNLQNFSVSMDIDGTPFERSVWEILLTIPYGERRTYGDMAKQMGKPGGARAVGRANGANYLAIVVPCHRVVESGGGLRGYAGGLWRKQKLLDLESGVGSLL